MTKKIRIENADTSHHNVMVQVQRKLPDGTWESTGTQYRLDTPTQLLEQYIHSGQRLVIEDVPG